MLCPYCGDLPSVHKTQKDDGNLRSRNTKLKKWTDEELQYMREYQCKSCGGDIFTDDTTSATLCPYCGNAVMLCGRLSGIYRPQKVIPFQISKEQALDGLDRFIGDKRYVHRGFLDKRRLEEVKGVYVPFWIYDATVEGDMTFKCFNERVWTEGDYRYTQRNYYRARRSGEMDFKKLPVVASTKVSEEMMESLEPFDHMKSEQFLTGYLSGYVADKYDIEEEDAFYRARDRMSETIESELCSTVDYDDVRIDETDTVVQRYRCGFSLYPVWLMSTVWNGKVFSFAMNGQSGKMAGSIPLDWSKLLGVSALIALIIAAVFSLVGYIIDTEYLFPGYSILGSMMGVTIGALYFRWFRMKLNNVHHQNSAGLYSVDYSFNLTDEEDEFLYKEVFSRKINGNDDD